MALDLFNAKLQELVGELCESFPDTPDFRTLRTALSLSLALSPETPRRCFNKYVTVPYSAQILKRDHEFFLANSFDDKLVNAGDLDILARVRSVWGRMTAEDQDAVWKYLQVLIALDNRIALSSSSE